MHEKRKMVNVLKKSWKTIVHFCFGEWNFPENFSLRTILNLKTIIGLNRLDEYGNFLGFFVIEHYFFAINKSETTKKCQNNMWIEPWSSFICCQTKIYSKNLNCVYMKGKKNNFYFFEANIFSPHWIKYSIQ